MQKSKIKAQDKYSSEYAKEKIHQGVAELKKILFMAKTKFDEADDKTKRNIVAGVAGSVALIAGAIGLNKMRKNRKKK